MERKKSLNVNLKTLSSTKGQVLTTSTQALVKETLLAPGQALPLVYQPTLTGVDLIDWVQLNRESVEKDLLKHGGVLFRGFNIKSIEDFEKFSTSFTESLLEYTYRSTPRKQERGNIYTSTEYPADQLIPYHNENAYTSTWPMKIWFFCVQAAQRGGETPIADSRKVYERIHPDIRQKFAEKGVMYVRNYVEGVDIPWQEVFQTTDKEVAENYCREHDIQFEWLKDKHLRTSQVCQGVAQHPKTQEMIWFNQAHLFHISALPLDIATSLLAAYGEEGLPRNAYYGDGTAIEHDTMDTIREAYQQEGILFPWHEGDILMLDNMLVAHARSAYVGPRKILVGMADAFSLE